MVSAVMSFRQPDLVRATCPCLPLQTPVFTFCAFPGGADSWPGRCGANPGLSERLGEEADSEPDSDERLSVVFF